MKKKKSYFISSNTVYYDSVSQIIIYSTGFNWKCHSKVNYFVKSNRQKDENKRLYFFEKNVLCFWIKHKYLIVFYVLRILTDLRKILFVMYNFLKYTCYKNEWIHKRNVVSYYYTKEFLLPDIIIVH